MRAARAVHEQAEEPLGLRPALDRVLLVELTGVVREPPDPGLGLVTAADPALGERLEQDLDTGALLVPRPGADDLDRVVERIAVAERRDLAERLEPQLVVAVALDAGQEEPPAELLRRVVLEHRLRAPPALRVDPGTGEGGPD